MASLPVVEARNLVKRYGAFTAVDGVDFAVEKGECFGFLGPNGAGKSSTMRMVSCVSPVTSGTLLVDGKDVMRSSREIKAIIGVVPQENNLDDDLNVLQNLLVHCRYFDIPKAERRPRSEEALGFMELSHKAASTIDDLSGGMKRRLLIARALLNRPKLVVLDEPTTGLDPHARHLVWQRVRLLKEQGATVILSTHYMDEAAMVCDRLVIMDRGTFLTSGTPAEVIAKHGTSEVVEIKVPTLDKARVITMLEGKAVAVADAGDSVLAFGLNGHALDLPAASMLRRQPNLEDVFLRLAGKGLIDE